MKQSTGYLMHGQHRMRPAGAEGPKAIIEASTVKITSCRQDVRVSARNLSAESAGIEIPPRIVNSCTPGGHYRSRSPRHAAIHSHFVRR